MSTAIATDIPIFDSTNAPARLQGLPDGTITMMYNIVGSIAANVVPEPEEVFPLVELPLAEAAPGEAFLPQDFRAAIVKNLPPHTAEWRNTVASYIKYPTPAKSGALLALPTADKKEALMCLGKAVAAFYYPELTKEMKMARRQVHQSYDKWLRCVQEGTRDTEVTRALESTPIIGLSPGLTTIRDEAMAEPIPKHLATLVAGTRPLSAALPHEVWGYQQVMANRLAAVTAHFLSQNTTNFVGAGQARQMLLQTKAGRAFEDQWDKGELARKVPRKF